MNNKFRLVLVAISAVIMGSLVAASCGGESNSGFRDTGASESEASTTTPKQEATPKKDLRKKSDTPVYDGPITSFTVNEELHDFGDVEKGSQNPFTFILTNTGDSPLVIEKAKGSCSCTVPKKPEDPIMPGETGEIEVTFKPKPSQKGNITQRVTVTANTEPRETILKIKATVQQDETEEAPAAK